MDRGLVAVGLVLHAALDLAVGFGLGDGVPLVVELLASAESDLHLEAGALEGDPEAPGTHDPEGLYLSPPPGLLQGPSPQGGDRTLPRQEALR